MANMYEFLGAEHFTCNQNEKGRIAEGLESRDLNASDIINIETLANGNFRVWYKTDLTLLDKDHKQYPHNRE